MKRKSLYIIPILVVILVGALLSIKYREEKVDPGIITDAWPKDLERPPVTEEVTVGALPTFDKNPAQEKYFVPAPLDLASNPIGIQFKTRITEGYRADQPNFAGKYTLISWGCGIECFGWVIVNNATGQIFGDYMTEKLTDGRSSYGISFNIESNLLVINPSEGEDPEYFKAMDEHQKNFLRERKDSYPTRYFFWQEDKLVPIDSSN